MNRTQARVSSSCSIGRNKYTRTDLDGRIDKEWAGDTREQEREGYGTDDFGSELLFEQIAL